MYNKIKIQNYIKIQENIKYKNANTQMIKYIQAKYIYNKILKIDQIKINNRNRKIRIENNSNKCL